jgi:hypothetical protein
VISDSLDMHWYMVSPLLCGFSWFLWMIWCEYFPLLPTAWLSLPIASWRKHERNSGFRFCVMVLNEMFWTDCFYLPTPTVIIGNSWSQWG